MLSLAHLWLPILLSAAAVWIASAIVWMALPHHKGDFKRLPDEDAVMNVVRSQNLAPGVYSYPDCQDQSRAKNPEFMAKVKEGPVGMLHVWPPNAFSTFGRKMVMTFVSCVVVSAMLAYLGTLGLHTGDDFMKVFRFIGTAGIMAYCLSRIPADICFSTPPRTMAANFVDGIAYGLITGAIFAAMWPAM